MALLMGFGLVSTSLKSLPGVSVDPAGLATPQPDSPAAEKLWQTQRFEKDCAHLVKHSIP